MRDDRMIITIASTDEDTHHLKKIHINSRR